MSTLLRIETFGRLHAASDAAVVSAARRLAMLALLAASGDRGLSRDKLIAYLWPDHPAEKARHALEQLLYAMRKEVGDVFRGTNVLRLDPSRAWSDVEEFRRLIGSRDTERALELYRGPFLDGFYLADAPEFERWVDGERADLAGHAHKGLEDLAKGCAARGDHRRSVEWWRKLADAEPYDSRIAVELMRALAAAGNPGGALLHAQAHAERLRADLDLPPNPSVSELAAKLRTSVPAEAAGVSVQPRSPATVRPTDPVVSGAATATQRRSHAGITIGLAIAVAAVAGAALRWSASSNDAALDADLIAIPPFRVTPSDSSTVVLRDGSTDLISGMLSGSKRLRVLPARSAVRAWDAAREEHGGELTVEQSIAVARRLRAGRLLLGDAVLSRGVATVRVEMYDVTRGRRIAEQVASAATDEVSVIQQVVARVLAQSLGEDARRLVTLSESPAAVKSYLAGLRAFRAGDNREARKQFDAALEIDSLFAAAAFWQSLFDDMGGAEIQRRADIAWKLRDRMTERDRALLIGQFAIGPNYPNTSTMATLVAAAERAAHLNPDRPEAWLNFGQRTLVESPYIHLDWRERAAAAFDSAIALDSTFGPAISWRLETALALRDTAQIRKYARLSAVVNATSRWEGAHAWIASLAIGDQAGRAKATAVLRTTLRDGLPGLGLEAALHGLSLAEVEALVDEAARAPEYHVRPFMRYYFALAAFHNAVVRGRTREAIRRGDSIPASLVVPLAFAESGYDSLANEALKRPEVFPLQTLADSLCVAELWRVRRGDTTTTARSRQRIERFVSDLPPAGYPQVGRFGVCGLLLRTIVHRARAATVPTPARDSLEALMLAGPGLEYPGSLATLYLARWLAEDRQYARALRVVRRRPYIHNLWFMVMLPAHLRLEGSLAAQVGDTSGAIAAYRHFLALRDQPDPGPREQEVREVRAHLAVLTRR